MLKNVDVLNAARKPNHCSVLKKKKRKEKKGLPAIYLGIRRVLRVNGASTLSDDIEATVLKVRVSAVYAPLCLLFNFLVIFSLTLFLCNVSMHAHKQKYACHSACVEVRGQL